MTTNPKIAWSLGVAGIVVLVILIYMVIDGSLSLTYSRSENKYLRSKCELLAKLADQGLRGHSLDAVIKSAGTGVIAKVEGSELRLDNVVLRIEGQKIVGVDVEETCR